MTMPVVELGEWQSRLCADLQLAEKDRVLADSLSASERLICDVLPEGIRFTSKSWIGVVRFAEFEVHVRPKLAGDNLRLVEMIEFGSGLGAFRRYSSIRQIASDGAHLLDLLGLLFAEECERVLRAGLLSDYVEEEDELPVVRGRLLADRQVLRRFGRVDRVICRYDEHKQDVAENQLLAFTLDLCSRRCSHHLVRRRTRQLGHVFGGACDPRKLDLRSARHEICYDRLNEHYRIPHQLAWLLLDAIGITDLYATGSTRSFSFLLDMNRLFEAFVHQVLLRLVARSPLRVAYQRSDRSIIVHAGTNRPYARVVPDFLLRRTGSGEPKLVLDAKYKLYDVVRASTADIYQAFLYAYAFSGNDAKPTAALIYPSTDAKGGYHELCVRSAGHLPNAKVCLVGLPIPAVLDHLNAGASDANIEPLRKIAALLQDS